MDERAEAVRDLARIRDLMERAGRYSHLSGLSALIAGLLGAAGAVWLTTVSPILIAASSEEAPAARSGSTSMSRATRPGWRPSGGPCSRSRRASTWP